MKAFLTFFFAFALPGGLAFALAAPLAFAQAPTEPQSYTLLEGLPGIGKTIALGPGGLSSYLQTVFNLGIGIAVALAVVMIVIGGAQYLSTDAVFGKEEGKEKLTHAVWGLILALGVFIILNTVNPDILKSSLTLELKQVAKQRFEPGEPYAPKEGDCSDCVLIKGVQVKSGACGGTEGCKATRTLVEKLRKLDGELMNAGIPGIFNLRVTEAWPPTIQHKDKCHMQGTCVDANFTPEVIAKGITGKYVEAFGRAALNVSIRAVYEVKDFKRRDELMRQGAQGHFIAIVQEITAEHFSLYNN
ncbi:MAG: pilin [bacterium]|nr:pilin [bacterium]